MQPRKVLAVDDSKLMLKMYEVMLRTFAVVFASDGLEALTKLEEHAEIDLVLLDVNMPNMTGLEVLERLRGSGTLERLAVIIVSTEGHEGQIQQGLEAGATAYITKPFDSDKLLGVIRDTEKDGIA